MNTTEKIQTTKNSLRIILRKKPKIDSLPSKFNFQKKDNQTYSPDLENQKFKAKN